MWPMLVAVMAIIAFRHGYWWFAVPLAGYAAYIFYRRVITDLVSWR